MSSHGSSGSFTPVIHTSKPSDELCKAQTGDTSRSQLFECWCLHGAVGAASDWREFSSLLAEVGISTRAVDLWRFLQCESISMPEFAIRLNAEASGEVSRGKKRVLMAYSKGARLALHALLDGGPWDAAVIISGNPGLKSKQEARSRREADAAWAAQALTLNWARFLEKWNAQPIFEKKIRDEREDRKLMQRRREIARSFIDWSLGNQENLWERLDEISIPTLWLAGERDPKFLQMAREALPLSPHFSMDVAPDCGHRIPWENQEWLAKRVIDFLNSINE